MVNDLFFRKVVSVQYHHGITTVDHAVLDNAECRNRLHCKDKKWHGENIALYYIKYQCAVVFMCIWLCPQVTCIYNDHSVYVWDVHDVKKVGIVRSFLYHSSSILGLEVRNATKNYTCRPGVSRDITLDKSCMADNTKSLVDVEKYLLLCVQTTLPQFLYFRNWQQNWKWQ